MGGVEKECDESGMEGERNLESVYIVEISYISSLYGKKVLPWVLLYPSSPEGFVKEAGNIPCCQRGQQGPSTSAARLTPCGCISLPGLPKSPAKEALGKSSPASESSQKGVSNRTTNKEPSTGLETMEEGLLPITHTSLFGTWRMENVQF